MRTITPNQTFKHGNETYLEGQSYEVSVDDAEYFESAGWVGDPDTSVQWHALDIHNGQIGHSAEVN